MVDLVGGLVGGLLGFGSNLYNISEQRKADAANLAFAKEQFSYQQQLNDLAMQREDNAVQRRVADLENAGFNKRLAMSQSAGAQSLSAGNYNANQSGAMFDPMSVMSSVTGSINAVNQIRTTEADLLGKEIYNDLQKAQTLKTLKEAGLAEAQIEAAAQDLVDREYLRRNWEADIAYKRAQKEATDAQKEATKSQKKVYDNQANLYGSQKTYTDTQNTIAEYEKNWVAGNNGAPLSVQNSPRSFSAGPVHFSGPSSVVAQGMGEVSSALDNLLNLLGDSPIAQGFGDLAKLFLNMIFGGFSDEGI